MVIVIKHVKLNCGIYQVLSVRLKLCCLHGKSFCVNFLGDGLGASTWGAHPKIHEVKNILVCHIRNYHLRHQKNFATHVDTEVALRDRF